jgi:bacterioferritin-associated ferredoxin
MYVCLCHGITERQIREALDDGATSLGDVQRRLPVGSRCGQCLDTAHEVISEHSEGRTNCTAYCAA